MYIVLNIWHAFGTKTANLTLSSPHRHRRFRASKIETMAEVVVVFDFDQTIIDSDSDRWVINQLGAADLFNRLRPTLPWNSLMDRMMGELHSQGRTITDIIECLKGIPLDPHIASAIKSAHALGCDLRVASDANQFFIGTILEHYGILVCFSEINTNPTYIDEEGKLRILPYHSSDHGCAFCPTNMCKGEIIERIRATSSDSKRFIYVGDGRGDYCPSLRLKEGDSVMPRKNYPLGRIIHENVGTLKADVHEWSDGRELETVLLQLIGSGVAVLSGECLTPPSESSSVIASDSLVN